MARPPAEQWCTINGADLLDALNRASTGDAPDVVYLELLANATTEEPCQDTEDQPGAGVHVARILIERTATENDLTDRVTAENAFGETLALADALGMLRLAEHTLIDSRDWRRDAQDEP